MGFSNSRVDIHKQYLECYGPNIFFLLGVFINFNSFFACIYQSLCIVFVGFYITPNGIYAKIMVACYMMLEVYNIILLNFAISFRLHSNTLPYNCHHFCDHDRHQPQLL